jgi:hypothetical protein
MLRLLLCVGAVALLASDAQSKCLRLPMKPVVLTKADAKISPGGGVLVAIGYGKQDEPEVRSVEQRGWRFKHGGQATEPVIKVLAPGLAVYEVPADQATLVDAKRELIKVSRMTNAAMGVPKPTLHSATATQGSDDPRWTPSTRLVLKLSSPVPANVMGMIVYVGGKPVTWTVVGRDSKSIDFASGGHCANDIPGSSVPTSGDITVAWLDAHGRVSVQSSPYTIKST